MGSCRLQVSRPCAPLLAGLRAAREPSFWRHPLACLIMETKKITDFTYELPKEALAGMQVPGIIYADDSLIEKAQKEDVLKQVANVATLPGIVKASFAMPDIHLGYGFAVGGVAAFDAKDGVISPGGVGFDINCGVRVLKTNLVFSEIKEKIPALMHELSRNIPKGIGGKGKIRLNEGELREAVSIGVPWAVKKGYGSREDIVYCEEEGALGGANPDKVSSRAFQRGTPQLGTLGAGNHFLEIQEVAEIYDQKVAEAFGLFTGQMVVMIHTGSRGFGHQVASDYLRTMGGAPAKYGFSLLDRQLASAPIESPEGQDYYKAMACAMNYAWLNRHMVTHFTRQSLEFIFEKSAASLGLDLLYDVAHNGAKLEDHKVNGNIAKLSVHRKGATRSFGPAMGQMPDAYKQVGQPVFIPGDMGRASFILAGSDESEDRAFSSTAHGAGRLLSRKGAKKIISGVELKERLAAKGITVVAGHIPSLAEEAPEAYKDVQEVVDICEGAGLSLKIAKTRPWGVLKG